MCRSVTALMRPQLRGGTLEANRTLKKSWLRGPWIRNPPCSSLSRARRSYSTDSTVSAIHRRKIQLFPKGGAGALNFDSTNFSLRGPGQVPFDGCSPRPSIPPRIGVFSEQITPLCFQASPPRLNLSPSRESNSKASALLNINRSKAHYNYKSGYPMCSSKP